MLSLRDPEKFYHVVMLFVFQGSVSGQKRVGDSLVAQQ